MSFRLAQLSSPLFLSLLMAGGSVLAETGDIPRLSRERLFADAQAEVERIGQGFVNNGAETRRHRVKEQDILQAEKARHQRQYRHQTGHSYQYGENVRNRHTGMPSGSMGGGRGGGGRR